MTTYETNEIQWKSMKSRGQTKDNLCKPIGNQKTIDENKRNPREPIKIH